jgi:nucleoside phosphorylase
MEKRITILIPTAAEARFIAAPAGVRIVICGVGMAECAAVAAAEIFDGIVTGKTPDLMILAGIAGTYANYLRVGETFMVASEVIADMRPQRFQKTYRPTLTPRGFRSVLGNTVNAPGAHAARNVEADIENMEGAAFFAVCERLGVPAIELRTVSNRVGEPITTANFDLAVNRLGAAVDKLLSSLSSPA